MRASDSDCLRIKQATEMVSGNGGGGGYNPGQTKLPEKKPFSLNREFPKLYFACFPTPSPNLYNVVTTRQCPRNVFQHCKGERDFA